MLSGGEKAVITTQFFARRIQRGSRFFPLSGEAGPL
jgi:hypothetical protein